jgi:hypothetical protein
VSLQLEATATSVFNHPIYGNPGTAINVPVSYGVITTASGNRDMRLGARLEF